MQARRTDLDWLRIAAFGLLILYHVGMFYVTWDWHVKSARASESIEPLMLALNPWRLALLFFISGVATRFMLDKMSLSAFASARTWRLLPPLLLAIFVIVPPQSYYEVVDAMRLGQLSADPAWLDNFYLKYVTASGHWCDPEGCLITPTYNHMWFVAYLLIYTLIVAALWPLLKRTPAAATRLFAGPGLFVLPWAYLAAARYFLLPVFEPSHAVIDDWYVHATSFGPFLLGLAFAKADGFFAACARHRWIFLAIAALAFASFLTMDDLESEAWRTVRWVGVALREAQAWGAILSVIGFAQAHLRNRDGPVKRYLSEAVFPFYLVHQTAIVVLAFHLDKLGWPLWLEASVLISGVVATCVFTFEIVRRIQLLRPWFGLKSRASAPSQPNHVEKPA